MMMMYCVSALLCGLCFSRCLIAGSSQAEERCREGDIRLVDGPNGTALEGRVEICFSNQWGTICADNWDNLDASVACQQLGFSVEGFNITYPRDPGSAHLDEVSCTGNERKLSDCLFNRISVCTSSLYAGVRCQPSFPQNVMINTTDTSVLITWQPPGVTWPDHYNITLAYTKNSQFSNQSHTSTIQVLGSDTRMEYDRLVPQQNYSCCISSIYGSQLSSSCLTFKTEVLGSVSGSNKSATAIGILSFMTVLLVLLLVFVGVGGLTYPRCLRLRIKDRKYLSRISDFLDNTIYCSSNPAYADCQQPAVPSGKTMDAATDETRCQEDANDNRIDCQEDTSGDEDSPIQYAEIGDPPPLPDRIGIIYEEMASIDSFK